MADIATVATALKTELDAASVAATFNRVFQTRILWAKRQQKLEDANVLCVDVGPLGSSRRLFSRGRHLLTCNYELVVRKRFEEKEQEHNGKITDEEVSDLVVLVDSLWKYLMPKQPSSTGRPLTTIQEAVILGPTADQDIAAEVIWSDLETLRQFTGGFPLTIQVTE